MTDEVRELARRLRDLAAWLREQGPHAAEGALDSAAALERLQSEVEALRREVRYLRHYGNKDCTAMADEAMKLGIEGLDAAIDAQRSSKP